MYCSISCISKVCTAPILVSQSCGAKEICQVHGHKFNFTLTARSEQDLETKEIFLKTFLLKKLFEFIAEAAFQIKLPQLKTADIIFLSKEYYISKN